MNDIIIQFQDVWKKYDQHIALKNINFEVKKGEFITVIGSSGCGKTTMLKLINGLLSPDQGSVFVNGQDISQVDQIELRRRIGYVIQGVGLFPHLNIKKNIEFIPNILKYDKGEADSISRSLIKTVGLEESMLMRYPSELSGGQRQRVGVARALAASPEIMLMDEPFGALDEINRIKLQDELLRIHKELGITIFFITHDLREAAKLGDRVFVMSDGEIIAIGDSQEIMRKYNDGDYDFFKSQHKAVVE